MYYETFYCERLFRKDKANNLKTFQYKCQSDSIAYEYILSPTADFFVENVIPESVAPNILTFLGFFVNSIVIHLVFL